MIEFGGSYEEGYVYKDMPVSFYHLLELLTADGWSEETIDKITQRHLAAREQREAK